MVDENTIEVEAEVIEDDILAPRPVYVPAVIDAKAYLAAKGDYVAHMIEPYDGMDEVALAKMDLKEMKVCRADLNKTIKEVEDERKAIKRAYNEPLNAFEAKVAEMLEPARRYERMLAERIKGAEDERKALRRQSLEMEYESFAPALVPVVPFDRLLQTNPKWLNASYNGVKATEEMCDEVTRIAHDWEVLKKQRGKLELFDEAEAEFFRTLDVSKALEYHAERVEEQARIDEMKGDVEENRRAEEPLGTERKQYRFSAWLNDAELASLREWKNALHIGDGWKFTEVNDG